MAKRDLATIEKELANFLAYEPQTLELISKSMNVKVYNLVRCFVF